jgi:hypothetical protein
MVTIMVTLQGGDHKNPERICEAETSECFPAQWKKTVVKKADLEQGLCINGFSAFSSVVNSGNAWINTW